MLVVCGGLSWYCVVQGWLELYLSLLLLAGGLGLVDLAVGIAAWLEPLVAVGCLLLSRWCVAALARVLDGVWLIDPVFGLGSVVLWGLVAAALVRGVVDVALLLDGWVRVGAVPALPGVVFFLLEGAWWLLGGAVLWIGWVLSRGLVGVLKACLVGVPSALLVGHGAVAGGGGF
ncbi:hypothetical protein SAMN04487939_103252 [Lysobacter sp. yr284]|uniref:hypothetical protein n=1 Tax=Lysobacter sp. yr284 TaxID=1761791 RepID=UPI000895A0F7|nr:hypothetical protein [Lysobacter sp. yr284]SDY57208.1 hypothetical protein SAMN04487939_103252 [Lysobacter sp. yr284]